MTVVAFVALTVSVDDVSAVTEGGFAVRETVGAGVVAAPTVTVADAVAVPPLPVAVAVYVVVAEGVIAWVPPVAAIVYLLPSLPATVTVVALVALTVNIDEALAVTDAGLALMATVGAAVVPLPLDVLLTPQPDTRRKSIERQRAKTILGNERKESFTCGIGNVVPYWPCIGG